MPVAASASVQDLTPTGGYQLKLVGGVHKKVGGVEKSLSTPVMWPEVPMRGGIFGEGQHSGPSPHQLGGLGRAVTTPPPPWLCNC